MTQDPSSFDTQPPAKERDISPAMIIAAIILILAIIFIFQNTDDTPDMLRGSILGRKAKAFFGRIHVHVRYVVDEHAKGIVHVVG